jgi:prepilin-type N-terminal cleavage/methylation domain-containing protein
MEPLHLKSKNYGFTLMELMIVVALILLIAAGFLTNWQNQVERGRDATKKRDLANLQRALEEYANDNGCYPSEEIYNAFTCDSPVFESYGLKEFPCNDDTKQPYDYYPQADSCDGYRIFVNLRGKGDPDIARVGCDAGCVVNGQTYNFGVSNGVPLQ